MAFDAEYWSARIEGATDHDARQAVMKLRDAALHRSVIDMFVADGYMPRNFRRKQHLQSRSKGKRVCGRMRRKS